MKAFLATTCIVTGALLAGGCATKKYVQNTAAPIQAKVDQVGEQTNRNGQSIEDTRGQLKSVDEKAQSGISAAQERAAAADQHAATADQHAGEAMSSADKANKLGEKNSTDLTNLRSVFTNAFANIDDYKLKTSVAVPFGFNKADLTDDAKAELDKVATEVKSDRRFFIADRVPHAGRRESSRAPLNRSSIPRLKAGMSSGLRLETRLPSMTTS